MPFVAAILAFAYPFFTTNRTDYGYVFTQLPTNYIYKMSGVAFDDQNPSVRYEDILFYDELANERVFVKDYFDHPSTYADNTRAATDMFIDSSSYAPSTGRLRTTEKRQLQYISHTAIDCTYYYLPDWIFSPAVGFYYCFSDDDTYNMCLDPTSNPEVATNTVVDTSQTSAITAVFDSMVEGNTFDLHEYESMVGADIQGLPMSLADIYAFATYSVPITRFTFARGSGLGADLLFTNYGYISGDTYQSYFWEDTTDKYEYLYPAGPQTSVVTNKLASTTTAWYASRHVSIERQKAWDEEKDRVWSGNRGGWQFTFSPKFDGWARGFYYNSETASSIELDLSRERFYYKNGSNGTARISSVRAWHLFRATMSHTAYTDINDPDTKPYRVKHIQTDNVTSNVWFVMDARMAFSRIADREYHDSHGAVWTNKVAMYSVEIDEDAVINTACSYLGITVPAYDNPLPDLPSYAIQNFTDWDDTEADDYYDDNYATSSYGTDISVTLMYIFGYIDCDMNATIPQEGDSQ